MSNMYIVVMIGMFKDYSSVFLSFSFITKPVLDFIKILCYLYFNIIVSKYDNKINLKSQIN